MVELLSPIALHDALAAASYGFRGCWFYASRGLIALIVLQVLISSYSYSGRRGGRYSVKRYSYSMAV
jgi:hypothetical protein